MSLGAINIHYLCKIERRRLSVQSKKKTLLTHAADFRTVLPSRIVRRQGAFEVVVLSPLKLIILIFICVVKGLSLSR
jgi:hypothetical protein